MLCIWTTVVTLFVAYYLVTWALTRIRIKDCDGKYVLITGCDTGFGNHLAKRLDDVGFHVFATCLTSEGANNLQKQCSRNVGTCLLDVRDETSIENARQLVENTIPEGKGLWGLVNNAGVSGVVTPLEWQTQEDWAQCLSVNLFGTVRTTRAFLPLVRQAQGRVVNVSSVVGRIVLTLTAPYCVSKYGVEAFSDALRRETYDQGIKVCVVEPGHFKTSIMNVPKLIGDYQKKYDKTPDDIRRHYAVNYTVEKFTKAMQLKHNRSMENVHVVIDALVLALTSKFPPTRQLAGNEARFLYRILWNLPTPLTDWILHRFLKKAMNSE